MLYGSVEAAPTPTPGPRGGFLSMVTGRLADPIRPLPDDVQVGYP
jgi:hypothetical protein